MLVLVPLVWGLLRRHHGLPMFGPPSVAQLEDPTYKPGIFGMKKVGDAGEDPRRNSRHRTVRTVPARPRRRRDARYTGGP